MAYIYQITNIINQKIYIGKTEYGLQKRFKEHCQDAFSRTKEKRPLYAAMRKYGVENFKIELIEETNNPEEREKYWIEQKRSFKTGYNATMGGDGKRYLDYDLIISTYNEVKNVKKVCELCKCDYSSVQNILKAHNIEVLSQQEVNLADNGKIVKQYTLEKELVGIYPSVNQAAKAINKPRPHITECINGKRKTAYNYIWCIE